MKGNFFSSFNLDAPGAFVILLHSSTNGKCKVFPPALPFFRSGCAAPYHLCRFTTMADKHEETITVGINGGESNEARKSALPSSPLSSAPNHEDYGTLTMADQPPDTPSTSLNGRENTTATTPMKMAKGKRRVLVKKGPKKSKWNVDNILTDPKSPLASADLRVRHSVFYNLIRSLTKTEHTVESDGLGYSRQRREGGNPGTVP